MRSTFRMLGALALVLATGSLAFGQGGVTTSLSGVVVDASGAVVPGADVTAKHNATSAVTTAVTGENGTFTIPALNPGVYTVTVTLMGFKTAVLHDVVLNAATPASVRVTLEVGELAETVVVTAASEIVQTQAPVVSVTVDANRIINLPLSSRYALDFVTFLPGVQTAGGNRQSQINGLPRSAIAITWDGINIQDNHLKSTDGFFAVINPRLDAIEEVTLTGAAQGAEATGQGTARINFVTRSGSNRYTGSSYHYFRHDALNANTWQRNRDGLPKANLLQNQPGTRVGGPISVPGWFSGRDKAFFFVNYEEFRQPSEYTRTRTILHPLAQQGVFRYNVAGTVREVNVLELAARNGQLASTDPVITKLLADIREATGKAGTISPSTNPSHESYFYPGDIKTRNYFPTVRVDYNLTQAHRLTGTHHYQNFSTFPDTLNNAEARFPGFPNAAGQGSWRKSTSFTLRSTLTRNLVNEAQVGIVNYNVDFAEGVKVDQFSGAVGNQNGFNLTLGFGLTSPSARTTFSGREAPVREVKNTLSWVRGAHNLSLGGSWTKVRLFQWAQTLVPGITLGVDSADPANAMFTTANFPGASNAQLNDARALYALLTGRVTQITGNAVLNEAGQYVYNGNRIQRGSIQELGLFVQDAWKIRPNLTINAGLRWELQLPFVPGADNYTTATYADVFGISGLDASGQPNLFKPGVMTGRPTEFVKYGKGTRAYRIDYGNLAPTVGGAWVLPAQEGWRARLLGRNEGDSVLRAGFSKSFNRNGMSDYAGTFGSNPGSQLTATRSQPLGNLDLDGRGLPVLFRDAARLGPPPFPTTPDYPLTVAKGSVQVTESVNIFDPAMQTPYAYSWNVGWSRQLTRDMAVEIRYVGTRSRANWRNVNYNEFNIIENGFLDEFRRAQANLQANIAAGRGNTFAFTGAPGTSPLPIFLAYFNGVGATQAGNPAVYTGTNWTNSTFLGYLALMNPQPFSFASAGANGLLGNATRRANAARAGLPENFFVVNPGLLGGANVRQNVDFTHYDSLQIELRRRLSQGLQMQASYVYGHTYASDFYSVRRPVLESLDTGSPGTVPHAFKTDWVYELPIGRGQRFGSTVGGVLDRIIGGWAVAGTARVQSGQTVDFGNVRLVGMTVADLKKLYGRYEFPQPFAQNPQIRVYRLPQDVVENSLRAAAGNISATSPTGYGDLGPPTGRYLAPANGPDCIETIDNNLGDCGTRVLQITGPPIWYLDLSVVKRVQITRRVNAEFRTEFLNAFNHPVLIGGTIGDSTGAVTPSESRVIQLVTRVNW